MPSLFSEIQIRSLKLRNRIAVSPMCQYSAPGGLATDWHLVHLGARAVGGAGLVIAEASAVEQRGQITPTDLGIWSDEHIAPLERITKFIKAQGAVPGIQLAHAGRKASTRPPWEAGAPPLSEAEGAWQVVGASPIAFADKYPLPHALSVAEIGAVKQAWLDAARRAEQAGFEWLEIHAAHGYLLHSFYSPLSNQRSDAYGGDFEGRTRLVLEITRAVREQWPVHLPLSVRISSVDWVEGGWTLDDSVALARELKNCGADLIDCSSGGNSPLMKIPIGAGYQVPFAERIRHEAEILTSAVGLITDAAQADEIIRNGRADLVLMAREFLRDPYWPLHQVQKLHVPEAQRKELVPVQYGRAI